MIRRCVLATLIAACGDDGSGVLDAPSGELTLATCTTTVGEGVPEPFKTLFHCVEMTLEGTDLAIKTTGLPPHPTYYYGSGSPNFIEWDDRGGAYHPNPNKLVASTTTIVVPLVPTSRNLTITAGLVDGAVGTSGSEYRQGPAGVALDSVILFNPLAAPGDDIADEQFTFDPFNAHPAPGGQYHYHRDSPGPVATGIEAYGIMCDGTLVLGCTELDGTAPNQTDLDVQNGHSHFVEPLDVRYHVHLCPAWVDHPRPYTPEIQFYDRCTVR
jgi:hypothetical protein